MNKVEWKKLEDESPNVRGESFLTIYGNYETSMMVLPWDNDQMCFVDNRDSNKSIPVTHWAYLPEPPEEK